MAFSLRHCALQFLPVGVCLIAPAFAAAQPADTVPRTPWGHPDLQGVWDYRTTTPLDLPENHATTVALTDEAAAAFVQQQHDAAAQRREQSLNADWIDRLEVGLADGRTALTVDPPNGRRPPLTPEAETQRSAWRARSSAARSYEDRGPTERCIVRQVAPIWINGYNNNLLLLQTPDTVVLFHEMIHDAVIIPLDARPPIDQRIRQWLGRARGHWEGDTLVVETTHRHAQWSFPRFHAPTPNSHVIERFTRVDEETLRYEYTVTDPETFTAPWSVEFPMQRTDHPLYEYACHEGIRSMPLILTGARAVEVDGGTPR